MQHDERASTRLPTLRQAQIGLRQSNWIHLLRWALRVRDPYLGDGQLLGITSGYLGLGRVYWLSRPQGE
jgi:hypothetical protein